MVAHLNNILWSQSFKKVVGILLVAITIGFFSSMQLVKASQPEPLRVAVLAIDTAENPFWGLVIKFMLAVAKDLNIKLEIKYSKENPVSLKRDGLALANSSKYDFLLTPYWGEATRAIFPITQQNGIGLFIFNSDVFKEHTEYTGEPRERFRQWIGLLTPDDKQAGYILGQTLIEHAQQMGKTDFKNNVHMFGLNGHDYSTASLLRLAGLNKYIYRHGGALLHEVVYAHWRADLADKITIRSYGAFPHTSVIWAASDSMSLGAVKAMNKLGKTPGKDFFTGGIDWSQDGVDSVAKGEMTATVGGHYMNGGWALVLIHDFVHDIDFADELGTRILTPMQVLTAENVKRYKEKMHPDNWGKIDFKKFSKVYNKQLNKYDFSLDRLLE